MTTCASSLTWLLPLGLLLALAQLASSEEACALEAGARAPEVRANMAKLRQLLRWQDYKRFFHKEYSSPSETLRRIKIFMANSLGSCLALMHYLAGSSSYYLTLNRFSDQTHQELASRFGVAPDQPATRRRRAAPEPPKVEREGGQRGGGFMRLVAGAFCSKKPKLAMLLDWRRSCLNPPQDQGDCGSCYAMATLKLLEWQQCRAAGGEAPAPKFSEQLLVDCGQPLGLGGCRAGSLANTARFVEQHGLALAEHWPYVGREQQCPAPGQVEVRRARRLELKRVERRDWLARLQEQPLVVNLALPEHFFDYAGGVFEGTRCDPNQSHFMVLVGHGIEDGRPFWLLANSFGPDFGVEGGYFRLSRRRDACLAYAVATRLEW